MGGDHSTAAFAELTDLASARVGGRAIAANDDFFAPRSSLLKPEPAIFIPGKFTVRGKWMDGWETRRRRTPGHDWCIIALGMRGRVRGVNVDTSHFTGNYPPYCSIDALDVTELASDISHVAHCTSHPPSRQNAASARQAVARGTPHPPSRQNAASARQAVARGTSHVTSHAWARLSPRIRAAKGAPWVPLLPESPLRGDSNNCFAIDDERPWTHVRLNIFPDGGVARLRVYGEVIVDWQHFARSGQPVDLAALQNGGRVIGASDMHFGARDNLIMPGRAKNMGEGWETRRRRGPGHDWAIVSLGAPGLVTRVEIDTHHFKGNYPESASLDGCLAPGAVVETLAAESWIDILPRTNLRADHRHLFSRELLRAGPISHVRLNIFPDGGVSRLRVYGTVAPA